MSLRLSWRVGFFLVLTTLLSGAELLWKTPGACLTPSGTPCRTLLYESSGWANQGWGFFNVARYRGLETEAVSRDGTAMLRSTGTFRRQKAMIEPESFCRERCGRSS